MRLLPTSVRTRLTLWYTLALALPLVAFAVASYLIFSHTVRARTDAFMVDALTVFARELGAERRAGPALDVAMRRTLREVRFREVDIVILDGAGDVVGTSGTWPAPGPAGGRPRRPSRPHWPRPGSRSAAGGERLATCAAAGGAYRVLVRPLRPGRAHVPLAGRRPLPRRGGGDAAAASVGSSWSPCRSSSSSRRPEASFLARRSFRPVSAMASRAAEIGASTLHERLPVVADDELGELARVLNDLLDRLERSFEQQRRFMTDASHELRTPTAIVRTEADVTLSREARTEEEYRASMAIVQDASRRLAPDRRGRVPHRAAPTRATW